MLLLVKFQKMTDKHPVKRILQDKLLTMLKHFPAVAILGARQTGKTTLSKMLAKYIKKEVFYLDIENPQDAAILANPLNFFNANEDKCIILDEIQRMPELFPVLRSIIDKKREAARFILLGSASTDLLFMSTETLTGRIVYTELTPFVFAEVENILTIQQHWMTGGFPQIVLNKDIEFQQQWFKSFFTTYVERDFRMLGLNANPSNLSRFFMMLAHSTGNILNKANIAKSLGHNNATIANYLDYFESAFLIRLLPAWHINLKKRIIKSPKIYIRDSGLLHYLLRIKDYNMLLGHPMLGHSWEGYIIEQITGTLPENFSYYYYRTQDGTECDLLITDGTNLMSCIEIKFTDTPKRTKSFITAINDLKTPQNFIIIPENRISYSIDDKIIVCNLSQFFELFNNWPKD